MVLQSSRYLFLGWKAIRLLFVENEAYHADEHRSFHVIGEELNDADLLMKRLYGMTDEERQHLTVTLFLSPQALKKNTRWTCLLTDLAKQDCISLLCIDEAHSVNLHGRGFCPEFEKSVETI